MDRDFPARHPNLLHAQHVHWQQDFYLRGAHPAATLLNPNLMPAHHAQFPTLNLPVGLTLLRFTQPSSYGGIKDGDNTNDPHAQILHDGGMHHSCMPSSPRLSTFHLTPSGEPTSLLLRMKTKPGLSVIVENGPSSANVSTMVNDRDIEMDTGCEGVPEDGCRCGQRSQKAASGGLPDIDIGSSDSSSDFNSRASGGQESDSTDDDDECDNNSDASGEANVAQPEKDDNPMTTTVTSECIAGGLNARSFKGLHHPLQPIIKHQQPLNGVASQQQMSDARHAGNHSHSPVEDNNNNSGSEVDESCKPPREKAHTFHNENLPRLPHTALRFGDILIPRWLFYFFSLDSPWKLANPTYVTYVQGLWDCTFPKIKCVVALQNEPIFTLVKQRTYDWRRDLVARAVKAVKAFFDWYTDFETPKARAAYVKWAVPEVVEVVNACGRKKPVPPSLFPYMWGTVDESDPDNPVPKGAFLHPCILDTFAFYLESTRVIKPHVIGRSSGFPHGALALATVAMKVQLKAHSKVVIAHKWLPHEMSKVVTAAFEGVFHAFGKGATPVNGNTRSGLTEIEATQVGGEECSFRGKQVKEVEEENVLEELAAYKVEIKTLAKKYGVMVEMYFPTTEAILQPTPIPMPAFNTADRYTSSLAEGECLITELDSILPDHINRVQPSNHFQDVFASAMQTGHLDIIHKLCNNANNIFGLPKSHSITMCECLKVPTVVEMLGVKDTSNPTYSIWYPFLLKDMRVNMRKPFSNWKLLSQILKVALWGQTSLADAYVRHGGPITNGQRWQISAVTPGCIAWAATLSMLLLSPDSEFPGNGTGAVSKILYRSAIVAEMNKFVFVHPKQEKSTSGMAEDVMVQIDAALAAMDAAGLTDDENAEEDTPHPVMSPPGSPLTSDKNLADSAGIPSSTVSENIMSSEATTTTTQGRGRSRGRGRGRRVVT
ncbi:hypothetical protein SCLCIDRAFT_24482 [Scleroderma citrinum Foug A]|uniref:Uncharacterized protein n=1 Tax=Scleroderma citrinum Foug A TaxID=1036808 RepID=A0A0C3DR39_9AGAM|nr:hypothetical protein SCLCIDRAFT_24482 [Scleroderma citrinum Foug A]